MIIYGKQVVFYYLKNHPKLIEEIYLAKECEKQVFNELTKLGVKINRLDFIKAQALAKGGNHQGFLAKVKEFEPCDLKELKDKNNLVILCELSDVGNIGSIARSAYALGFDGMIYYGNNINLSGAIRTSAGALIDLKFVHSKDILTTINELKQVGFTIYAANNSLQAIEHNKVKFGTKNVLLLGSEGNGVSKKILKACNKEIKINMKNNFDSLNVSSAFAILGDRMINE